MKIEQLQDRINKNQDQITKIEKELLSGQMQGPKQVILKIELAGILKILKVLKL